MISDTITVDVIIEVLNRALAADGKAIRALFVHRVPCNRALANDPTIQVADYGCSISILGLINGIAGVNEDGWGPVAAVFDVVCENACDGYGGGMRVGEKCPRCGDPLVLGELVRFERTCERKTVDDSAAPSTGGGV